MHLVGMAALLSCGSERSEGPERHNACLPNANKTERSHDRPYLLHPDAGWSLAKVSPALQECRVSSRERTKQLDRRY